MKNIYLIPTDKPSRLWTNNLLQGKLELSKKILIGSNTAKHIYITSDEEIKEGDYSFYPPFGVGENIVINGELCFHIERKNGKGSFTQRTYQTLDLNKKIILTTDQDLIKDGVQPIDDEFLEWFVKNPSCEFAHLGFTSIIGDLETKRTYKIIIPKEESKQCTCERPGDNTCDYCDSQESKRILEDAKLSANKQETLEEAAERLYPIILEDDGWDKNEQYRDEWIEGAKWQQEQEKITTDDAYNEGFENGKHWQQEKSYSEEEVKNLIKIIEWYDKESDVRPNYTPDIEERIGEISMWDWFEQFKKK